MIKLVGIYANEAAANEAAKSVVAEVVKVRENVRAYEEGWEVWAMSAREAEMAAARAESRWF